MALVIEQRMASWLVLAEMVLMLGLELEWFEPLVSMKMDDNNDCTFRLVVDIHFDDMLAVVGKDEIDMNLDSY